MDWKSYYRTELEQPESRGLIEEHLDRAEEHSQTADLIRKGAILSFPHTARAYAVPLQARVVVGLHRAGVERVIALGVLHTSLIPPPYIHHLNRLRDPSADPDARKAAFSRLAGAFLPAAGEIVTPFGDLPTAPVAPHRLIREDAGILEREFSLDTFLALMAFYADRRGIDPLPVAPLYVGITYDPTENSFAVATELAQGLRRLIGPKTAVVTTGDLVHYGTAYGDEERISRIPEGKRPLEGYFRRETEEVLALALTRRNLRQALIRSSDVLKSDQRYIVPVIAELLGPKADYEIIHFELSDYAGILSVAPPCYVASSLVAFVPA